MEPEFPPIMAALPIIPPWAKARLFKLNRAARARDMVRIRIDWVFIVFSFYIVLAITGQTGVER